MKRSPRRAAGEKSPLQPPHSPAPRPAPPPAAPTLSARSSPLQLLARYRLPILLSLSLSVAAFSAYQYQKHRRTLDHDIHTPSRRPTYSLPSLYGRCPVLVASSADVVSANPVLHRIGEYGLPALPYADPDAAYAYPLLVRESYVGQYNPRTRNANFVIELLNAATPTPPPLPSHDSPALLSPTVSPPNSPLSSSSTPPSVPPSPLSRSSSAPTPGSSVPMPPSPVSGVSRELSSFRTDQALLSSSSPPTPSAYLNSSFDRGHLVPAADAKTSQRAMDDTFLLTNISPQHPQLNRGYWRALEGWVRSLRHRFTDVLVVTGPLWLPEGDSGVIADTAASETEASGGGRRRQYVRYEVIPSAAPSIAVPTHFFKIVVASSAKSPVVVASFVVPNAPIPQSLPLTPFLSSLAAIQHSAGFTFFPLLQPDDTADKKHSGAADKKPNVIDLVSVLAGDTADGDGEARRKGMTALERRSALELCAAGGCDLSRQFEEIAAWDEHNRRHKREHITKKAQ